MKTLIINGSPRRDGDTAALLAEMKRNLSGEVLEISAYHGGISPCVDCRHCWRHDGCAIEDGMQKVYRANDDADNVIVASPIYFSRLTGPMMSLASRFQCYYAAKRFKGVEPEIKRKHGVLVLTGGGDGSADPAIKEAGIFFRYANAEHIGIVLSLNTDRIPAAQDVAAMAKAREFALELNRGEVCDD